MKDYFTYTNPVTKARNRANQEFRQSDIHEEQMRGFADRRAAAEQGGRILAETLGQQFPGLGDIGTPGINPNAPQPAQSPISQSAQDVTAMQPGQPRTQPQPQMQPQQGLADIGINNVLASRMAGTGNPFLVDRAFNQFATGQEEMRQQREQETEMERAALSALANGDVYTYTALKNKYGLDLLPPEMEQDARTAGMFARGLLYGEQIYGDNPQQVFKYAQAYMQTDGNPTAAANSVGTPTQSPWGRNTDGTAMTQNLQWIMNNLGISAQEAWDLLNTSKSNPLETRRKILSDVFKMAYESGERITEDEAIQRAEQYYQALQTWGGQGATGAGGQPSGSTGGAGNGSYDVYDPSQPPGQRIVPPGP